MPQKIKLTEFFRLFRPTHVLGTTYTVSLMFFESAIWPCINHSRLERCLILCDRTRFQKSSFETVGLCDAGHAYLAAPVPIDRTFHPKVWLMLNEEEVALLVGSGNLTQSGFIQNLELFNVIRFNKNAANETLTKDIQVFLAGLEELFQPNCPSSKWVSDTLRIISKRLATRFREDGISGYRFFTSFHGRSFPSLLAEVTGPVEELCVAAPYFAGSSGLFNLAMEISPSNIRIYPGLVEGTINIDPVEAVKEIGDVKFGSLSLSRNEPKKFSHFKIYGFLGIDGNYHIFNGSVNCTEAAMLPKNIEAGLLTLVEKEIFDDIFSEVAEPTDFVFRPLIFETPPYVRHLFLWGSQEEERLILTLPASSAGEHVPLRNIIITLRCGSFRGSLSLDIGFHCPDSSFQLILSTKSFSIPPRIRRNAFVLELSAIDREGRPVAGSCVVNDIANLTLSPTSRSMLSAASKIASGIGGTPIPEVLSLFAFVERSLLPNAIQAQGKLKKGSDTSTSNELKDVKPYNEQEIAFPPTAVPHLHGSGVGGNGDFDILKNILASLSWPDPPEDPLDDEEESEGETKKKGIKSGNKKVSKDSAYFAKEWSRIVANLTRLQKITTSTVLDENRARNILVAAPCVILAVLRVRRDYDKQLLQRDDYPSAIDLLTELLAILFNSRNQSETRVGIRYLSSDRFPPIAEDARITFGTTLLPDAARIYIAMFAYVMALDEKHNSARFPKSNWLLLRILVDEFDTLIEDEVSIKRIFDNLLKVDSDALTWNDMNKALSNLAILGWDEHPGLGEYLFLKDLASSNNHNSQPFPEVFLDDETIIKRMAKEGKLKFISAEGVGLFCHNKCCPKYRFQDEPLRFQMLAQMRPVLCKKCLAVNVPQALLYIAKGGYSD